MEASMTYEEQIEARQENTALRARVARLEEALKDLLDYTRACEDFLNASESGVCVKARRALEVFGK